MPMHSTALLMNKQSVRQSLQLSSVARPMQLHSAVQAMQMQSKARSVQQLWSEIQSSTNRGKIHAGDPCVVNAHAMICAVQANRVYPAIDVLALADVRLCCRS